MFKIESLTNPKPASNQVDLLHQQMECVSSKLKSDLIDKQSTGKASSGDCKSTDDEHLTGESLVEDEFNQQRVGSAEFTSQSSSDESAESSSGSSSSEEDEPAISHSFRQMTNQRGVASSINRAFKPKNKEDLFNSLEVDRFAPKKLFGEFFIQKQWQGPENNL